VQNFTSRIHWQCPACGHVNDQEVDVPELNYAAEKTSDMAVDDQCDITCDGCDLEYFGHVWVGPGDATFEIEEPHEFTIHGDMPSYSPDPEDYYEPADDPHSIAREALGQLKSMIGTKGPVNDPQFMNRLIFAGAVSSFEAYLGDTLINAVQDEKDVQTNLLKENRIMGEEKFTAAELASDPDAVSKRIVSKLKDILFHNLSTATSLYAAALGIELMPEDQAKSKLYIAMKKRHDCVHRNGSDKDGNKLDDFTDEYVHETLDAIIAVIDRVEMERLAELPF